MANNKGATLKQEEQNLQTKLLNWLNKRDLYYPYKTTAGVFKTMWGGIVRLKAGMPDMMVFIDGGKTIFIELKTDVGTFRDEQKEVFPELMKRGFQVFIMRPKHWENFKTEYKLQDRNLEKTLLITCELYKGE